MSRLKTRISLLIGTGLLLAACAAPAAPPPTSSPVFTLPTADPTVQAMILAERDPDVPELPFPDNPDPAACGIPVNWGSDSPAWLTGVYAGELVQPVVLLYDSHLRLKIAGEAQHGTQVEVVLYQQNPVIDYYFVRVEDGTRGWIPAPFLSFSPVQ